MIKKFRVKGRVSADGVIEPDLPEHKYVWRFCQYDRKTNIFEIVAEFDDEAEFNKIIDYIELDYSEIGRQLKELRELILDKMIADEDITELKQQYLQLRAMLKKLEKGTK
ncbi:MAG: hypothetical protein DRO40_07935 [Thermoprotei archaeon]|nr:MAG: hypothetical protein DRO40_07935 [Thermoprotei archaeon]